MARVYIIEDDPMVRVVVRRILENSGHQVEAFQTSEAAMIALEENPPDLALVDVQLPLTSGIELSLFIEDVRPGTPVLFMSGYGPDDLARLGLPEGAPLIYKPFAGGELPRAVRAMIEPDSPYRVPRFGGPQPH